jgi:peptide-methionine (S)-S-oxide reductase
MLRRLINGFLAMCLSTTIACHASSAAVKLPNPTADEPLSKTKSSETVVLAGGCFWGIQAVFEHVKGVTSATAGYSGGSANTAQYETVSTGRTGQGPDEGTQYRSVIFYASEDQHRVARAYIDQLNGAKVFAEPIVTQVVALQAFYPAEGYHQDYAEHHPHEPYIAINDLPKIDHLKQTLPELYVGK